MASSLTVRPLAATRSGLIPPVNRYTTVPNHSGDVPEGTLRAILKRAGIGSESFFWREWWRGRFAAAATAAIQALLRQPVWGFTSAVLP